MSLFAARTRLLGTENAFKVGPDIARLEAAGHRVLRCNLGEPDFAVPAPVVAEVKRQLDLGNTHYTDPQGLLSLRRTIARQLSETRGIDVTAERVVVFCGAKPPIGFAQQAYVDPGDEIVYPSPGFPIYESFTRFVGAVPVPVHLRSDYGFALDPDDLAERVGPRTKLVILNFPSNPTGGAVSREQLEAIADVLRRQLPADARIYSDEVYEEILFDGRRHLSIASLRGMTQRTIVVSGVSKSFAWTGGRIGWAAFPTEAEAQLFKTFNINVISCLPGALQEGARVGLESPETRRNIATMVAAFQERRDFVVPALAAIPGIQCALPAGAFYAFPDVGGVCARLGATAAWESLEPGERDLTSPSTLLQRFLLFRYHVATLDRRSFGAIGAEGRHHLRVSFATAADDLREAMRRIATAADDVDGFANFLEQEAILPVAAGAAR